MSKSRSTPQKSTVTSAAATVELESTLSGSKRDDSESFSLLSTPVLLSHCTACCPACCAERLQHTQQARLQPTSSASKKRGRKLPHSSILSKLFVMDSSHRFDDQPGEVYSTPVSRAIVLERHQAFAIQVSETFDMTQGLPYSFTKTDLTPQLKYRMVSLIADPFSDQMDRMEVSTQLKINLLRIDHIHWHSRLPVKIISSPIWTGYTVHVVVQDENSHCLRLSIYNWSHVVNTRQVKAYDYIQERLTRLLPINSCIVLLDPWLKACRDGDIALRCDSPNTHLLMIDFETRCSTSDRTNVEQLRQWGNACYQADDNLAAIEFYTYGLRQIDEQQEKELTSHGNSSCSNKNEQQQHRIPLLSNRCACYLRERHATLALVDSSILLSMNELLPVLESPKTTTSKLLFRCLSAYLYLGVYDKVESLMKSHKFESGLANAENSASVMILERELTRLRDENMKGRYDLRGMLREQIAIPAKAKPSMMFIDVPHYHAACNRSDLFEVRPCQPEELAKHGYPEGSYGTYALKNIEAGTLLVVEQPFASIDSRVIGERHSHSINHCHRDENSSGMEYYHDETLRLLNEVEKQLLIGNSCSTTFDQLKLMQPIRQWLRDGKTDHELEREESADLCKLLEDDEASSLLQNQWRKRFYQLFPPPSSTMPWRILFETQKQNPFSSKSTLGWYPLGSMFNHSCLPNCLWYLIGDCLFIYVCASNIRPGDELTISYCPLWISSFNDRAFRLRQFDIHACQCVLCSYDRSSMPQYDSELQKFVNLRALARQARVPLNQRFDYVQQLKCTYDFITRKFRQRPVGFIAEFIDVEQLLLRFQLERSEINQTGPIDRFLDEQQASFLPRLSHACRFTLIDLPKVDNPILLFGAQLQLLVHHLERHSTRIRACDLKQWNRLLECLYEIFTFQCHSSAGDMRRTLHDHQQLFAHLSQTQTCFDMRTNKARRT